MPPVKRRYQPPSPDEDTFSTQREFLSSLTAVPIETIAENDRRCGHCWKWYGESDPGLDNAENPVAFRCGHAFGELCMKNDLFRLPEVVETTLQSLSFDIGGIGRNIAEAFRKAILRKREDPEWKSKTDVLMCESVGACWMQFLAEGKSPNGLDAAICSGLSSIITPKVRIVKVKIMENAIIYDVHDAPLQYAGTPPMHRWIDLGMSGSHKSACPAHLARIAQMVKSAWVEVNAADARQESLTGEQLIFAGPLHVLQTSDAATSPDITDTAKAAIGANKHNDNCKCSEDSKADIAANKEAVMASMNQWKQMRADEESDRVHDLRDSFVTAFSDVYKSFLQWEEATLEQRMQVSSPVARTPRSVSRSIMGIATLHAQDLGSSHARIKFPYSSIYAGLFMQDDSDSPDGSLDGFDVDDEPFTLMSEEKLSAMKQEPFLLISRQICNCRSACFPTPAARAAGRARIAQTDTTSVSWQKEKRVTNSCPLCAKVLFYRENERDP